MIARPVNWFRERPIKKEVKERNKTKNSNKKNTSRERGIFVTINV